MLCLAFNFGGLQVPLVDMFKNHPMMALLAASVELPLIDIDDEELSPIDTESTIVEPIANHPQVSIASRPLFDFDPEQTDELCEELLNFLEPTICTFDDLLSEQREIHSFVSNIGRSDSEILRVARGTEYASPRSMQMLVGESRGKVAEVPSIDAQIQVEIEVITPSSPTASEAAPASPTSSEDATSSPSPSELLRSPKSSQLHFWPIVLQRKRRAAFTTMCATKKHARKIEAPLEMILKDPDYSFIRDSRKKAVLSQLGKSSPLRFSEVHPDYVAREAAVEAKESVVPATIAASEPAKSPPVHAPTRFIPLKSASAPTPASNTKNPFVINWAEAPVHQRRRASKIIQYVSETGVARDLARRKALGASPDWTSLRRCGGRRRAVLSDLGKGSGLKCGVVHADYRPREIVQDVR